ncbi:MAG TPA: hypothetical protein VIU93_11515 [Gallionellaceae bacterium]
MKQSPQIRMALHFAWRHAALRRAAYVALAAMATVLLTALAWWWPASRQAAALQDEIAARRAVMVNVARMNQIAQAERQAARDIVPLESKLHARSSQADLVQAIARLANAHGVRVISQSFDEGKGTQGNGALYLDLGLSGSYPGLRGMIADLAGLPAWAEVVDASFERGSAAGTPLRAQLRLLTYRGGRSQS